MKLNDLPLPAHRAVPKNSWKPPAGVRIISSDDHNSEADHLFEERLPAKWKSKAPVFYRDGNRIVFQAEGRDLIPQGVGDEIVMGLPGQFDVPTHLRDMDAENIEAAMVFHGQFQALNGLEDKELYWACVDVYNEWLIEYLKPYSKRMAGVAILPSFLNPETARDYIQKIKQLGYKALQMPHSPKGIRWNSMSMEPVWAAIEESGLPLSFHAGAYKHFVGNGSMGANLTANLCPYRNLFGALVFSGALDRHPGLKVVFHEGGAAWVAQALVDMDYIVAAFGTRLSPKLGKRPAEYWKRQCYASFMVDPIALRLVDVIGEDNIMWCADYPHPEGTWGFSGELLKECYETLGPTAGAKFLGGNAARLWGI
ncbi:MAG TPA: amidohydrolase family protein [Burkholderiales bacterium]|nr:amidohydrolase family protein [Burkholderiales bacterium]